MLAAKIITSCSHEHVAKVIPFGKSENRLIFKTHRGLVSIGKQNIQYCQANGNYTRIFLIDGKECLIAKNLKYVETRIASKAYIRVHQSYPVPITQIEYVQTNVVVLYNGTRLPMARRARQRVVASFYTTYC